VFSDPKCAVGNSECAAGIHREREGEREGWKEKGEGDREPEGKVGEERCAVGIFNYFRLWVSIYTVYGINSATSTACMHQDVENFHYVPKYILL